MRQHGVVINLKFAGKGQLCAMMSQHLGSQQWVAIDTQWGAISQQQAMSQLLVVMCQPQ